MTTDTQAQEMGRITLDDSAPPIDLDLFVIENHGLAIQSNGKMGRVIVATRDFDEKDIGSIILSEKPALLCQQSDHMDFMESFLDLPEQTQVGILDMFYQPLDSPMGKSLVEPTKLLFVLGVLEDFTVIHQLLSIWKTNGMQWGQDQSALALFSSKFSHSCNPSLGFSTSNGLIEFTLLRPIKKGQVVTFSYLTDLLETSTDERRQLLMTTKSFLCECDRCDGPDYSRCVKDEEGHLTPCYYPYLDDNPFEPLWACSKCGLIETPVMLQKEQEIDQTLEIVNEGLRSNKNHSSRPDYSPVMLQKLVLDCQYTLSSVHNLTVKAMRLSFTVSMGMAFDMMEKLTLRGISLNDSSIHPFFRASVETGFALVLAGECCAANCPGCYEQIPLNSTDDVVSFNIRHDPSYDRTLPMRHTLDNLLQLPISWWPFYAVTMAERYLPLLKAKFGIAGLGDSSKDITIPEMERRMIQIWDTCFCMECGTYWDGNVKRDEE